MRRPFDVLDVVFVVAATVLLLGLAAIRLLVVPAFARMIADFGGALPTSTMLALSGWFVPAIGVLSLALGGAGAILRSRSLLLLAAVLPGVAILFTLWGVYAPIVEMSGAVRAAAAVLVVGRRDPALAARVVARTPLLYDAGADAAIDRPAHVRSGSALAWLGSRLAVVQDDAGFLALVDPRSGAVEAVTLPPGEDGRRQFDDLRGNKALKLDLEACVTLEAAGARTLLAFGSGSTTARERLVLHREGAVAEVVPAAAFYAGLRGCPEFAGSELNLEGAVVHEGTLLLVQRGNGAARGALSPVDATCSIDLEALLAHVRDPERPPPRPEAVTRYELGRIGPARLTFTDAALVDGTVYFLAAAEESPDATTDGPVAGVALGVLEPGRSARWEALRGEDGAPLRDKVEGLAPDPSSPRRFWAAVDRDEPGAPAELLEIELDRVRTR